MAAVVSVVGYVSLVGSGFDGSTFSNLHLFSRLAETQQGDAIDPVARLSSDLLHLQKPASSLHDQEAFLRKVERVVDGDTIYLMDGDRIRLYGIDAPEKSQPYGDQSAAILTAMVGAEVYVDVRNTDRYGRKVAVLHNSDGVNVNLDMVCVGAAWWYERYAKNERALRDCQVSARESRLGLWAGEATAPWEWRKR